jgi:hypothetical protein
MRSQSRVQRRHFQGAAMLRGEGIAYVAAVLLLAFAVLLHPALPKDQAPELDAKIQRQLLDAANLRAQGLRRQEQRMQGREVRGSFVRPVGLRASPPTPVPR